jgi:hypothetical protein
LIVTSEPLNIFKKMFQPVESQVIFLSLTSAIDVKIERVLTGFLIGWKYLASQNDSFTHGKVCAQMGSGQPRKCTTSDFHAVLFWFVYDTSGPLSLFLKENHFASFTNAMDLKIERVLTGFLIGWNRLFDNLEMTEKRPLGLLHKFHCTWSMITYLYLPFWTALPSIFIFCFICSHFCSDDIFSHAVIIYIQ